jgi:hypothetical protein
VTYLTQQYVSRTIFFSFLPIWPLIATDVKDFYSNFCLKRSCDYLQKVGFKKGDMMIGITGETKMCFTEPFESFLESMGCFERVSDNFEDLVLFKLTK